MLLRLVLNSSTLVILQPQPPAAGTVGPSLFIPAFLPDYAFSSVPSLDKILGKVCIWRFTGTTAISNLKERWEKLELTTVYVLGDWNFPGSPFDRFHLWH